MIGAWTCRKKTRSMAGKQSFKTAARQIFSFCGFAHPFLDSCSSGAAQPLPNAYRPELQPTYHGGPSNANPMGSGLRVVDSARAGFSGRKGLGGLALSRRSSATDPLRRAVREPVS